MKKYTLEELIEKDMIMIPDPDMSYMLEEHKGHNFMGLRHTGGVYLMIHEPTEEIIYVGISRSLGERIAGHKARGGGAGTLRHKLTKALGSAEADKQINNEIKVHIILESRESFQRMYESVLIEKYDPVYNIEGKQGGMGAGKKGQGFKDIPMDEIGEMYKAGKTIAEIAKEFEVSRATIGRRLKNARVGMRGKGEHNRKDISDQEIIIKYLAGKGTVLLGKEYDVDPKTIRGRLKNARVTLDSNVSKRKQLNAHIINAFDAEQMELYTLELKALELNTVEPITLELNTLEPAGA